MHADEMYRERAASLSTLFRRVEEAYRYHVEDERFSIGEPILAYAAVFQRVPFLNRMLNECIRDHDSHRVQYTALSEADREVLEPAIEETLEWLALLPLAEPQTTHWKGLIKAPLEKTPPDCNSPQGVLQELEKNERITKADWLRVSGVFKQVEDAVSRRHQWYTVMKAAMPWQGAQIVQAFGLAAEHVRRPGETDDARQKAIQIHKFIGSRSLSWSSIPEFEASNDADALAALTRFHDWVVEALLSRRIELDVFTRYAERVARYERTEYRLAMETAGAKRDEAELRRRMGIYLHDAGLNPVFEVPLGPGRADVEVDTGSVVVCEVKVLREDDDGDDIRSRIEDGIQQAWDYRRRRNVGLAHLIVFNAWEKGGVGLPARTEFEGATLAIHIVELRKAPSYRNAKTPVVRWSEDDVQVAAAR